MLCCNFIVSVGRVLNQLFEASLLTLLSSVHFDKMVSLAGKHLLSGCGLARLRRLTGGQEIAGSTPVTPTIHFLSTAPVESSEIAYRGCFMSVFLGCVVIWICQGVSLLKADASL